MLYTCFKKFEIILSLLYIYREYEMKERKSDDEYHYYSQLETTLNNELDLVHEKIGIFPNRYV